MNTTPHQGSAKIYPFPAGGRAALGARRLDEPKPAVTPESARMIPAACSGSWYHEAAIQEARPLWER